MLYYEVSPLKVTHAKEATLTYSSPESLKPGSLVTVEVGTTKVAAIVVKSTTKPKFTTKQIVAKIEQTPLPKHLLKLHAWLSTYYAAHPVAVWRCMLASGLTKTRRAVKNSSKTPVRATENFTLNSQQQHAVDTIFNAKLPSTHLLHGVTGAGKTAVYRELAERTVRAGQSVIILVPEIALTPQLVAEFTPFFKTVHVTHSTMTESARHTLWKNVLSCNEPQIIIGPRSALFMPVKNLGLIVIDECHEPSFKQEQTPRYSALRAASMLSRYAGAHLVMGSATPSVTDYYLAKEADACLELPDRARPGRTPATIELVDMTKKAHFARSAFLSTPLIDQITKTLKSGHQTLLFHNRRGSAPITLCESCGWSAACPRCFVPLTLHTDEYRLRCHLCGYHERVPTSCPDCHAADIIHRGIGTKRVEEELRRLFPGARIARFDGDTSSDVASNYQELYDGDIDIIIGTQVVAKGLDLPHLRLVGVVQADSGLSLPDYQSSERVFQLLSQVTGRVGRNEHASQVVIQSYQPSHPSVTFGLKQDYVQFYEWCKAERRRAGFPPFRYLLRLTAIYKTEAGAIRAAQSLMRLLRSNLPNSVELFGPAPSFYERLRGTYRWQIILKSTRRADLVAALDHLPPKGWQAELDPTSLL